MFNYFKKIAITNRANDEILYEYVMNEIEDNYKVKGLWAKAYANSNGDDNKVEPLYMQLRVQAIKDKFTALEIAYDELSRKQLFELIKNGLKNSSKNTQIDEEKLNIKQYNDTLKIEEAIKLLNTKGYKIKKYRDYWKVNEPLGGKIKIYNLQELFEYAQSREYHN